MVMIRHCYGVTHPLETLKAAPDSRTSFSLKRTLLLNLLGRKPTADITEG